MRDLSDNPAQIALERGQVERKLGWHIDDCADATRGGEEELLGRQSCCYAGSARYGDRVARRHGAYIPIERPNGRTAERANIGEQSFGMPAETIYGEDSVTCDKLVHYLA